MIDPAVQKQLADAPDPKQVQSVMLQWLETPEDSLFAAATSRRERQQIMDGFYRHLKENTFGILQNEEGIEIRDLPASGSAILTGPAIKLKELVHEGSVLDRDQKLQVLPNATFHALS